MKLATKIVYLSILVIVSVIPVVIWARSPATVDLAGVGAFIAGLGVPMGVLTGAMAATRISQNRNSGGSNNA